VSTAWWHWNKEKGGGPPETLCLPYWDAGTWYPVTEAEHNGKEVIPLEEIQVVLEIEVDSGQVLHLFVHSFIHSFIHRSSNY